MTPRIGDNARDTIGGSRPLEPIGVAIHFVRQLAFRHRILVSSCSFAVKFDGFGNLTKALTFFPQRAACVAELYVSEHLVIHAFDAGQNPRPQQQSTLFDQIGHFRKAQLGILKDLRGAVLSSLGHGRILRVHLLHGLSQGCHVIEHRKTSLAADASMVEFLPSARQLRGAR